MPKRSTFTKFLSLLIMLLGLSILLAACKGSNSSPLLLLPTYSISGSVIGDITQGVTIAVSGTKSANAVTDADGNYSVSGLPNGSYTVTPSKAGFAFAPVSIAVTIQGGDQSIAAFTSTIDNNIKYDLTGRVSGDTQEGVTINVTGPSNGSASTLADGTYTIANLPNGTYTVSASKPGYLFSADRAATIYAANSSGNDFTATAIRAWADGGTGTAGNGGDGGEFYAESYGGSVKVLKSGTVDASFPDPGITPNFGDHPFIVSNGTTTVPATDDTAGALCQVSGGDGSLYIGDGTGTCGEPGDTLVTGLTVAAGATLVLADQGSGASLFLTKDLLIEGTLTTDLSASSYLYIEANLIEVGSTGRISASATEPNGDGGEIDLGYGNGLTKTIINRGTIEAKGDGTGTGGYIYLEPDDLVVNYGTIDVSGGNAGGSGGEFDAFVDYGDFYSSGTVRMNGGNGDTGGETEYSNWYWYGASCWIETAYFGNANGRNGDIVISGTWEAKGGDGANGNGGSGGQLYFQTDGLGTVTVNASMSVKGGNGTGAGSWGGQAGEIDFYSYLDPYGDGYNDPTPGKISIAGAFDLRGGNGGQDGGTGGYLYVYSENYNSSGVGSDVEFDGFPVLSMNGGEGGVNGGNASDWAVGLFTWSSSTNFAKSITNEADVQAKGGEATLEGGVGGIGGVVDIETGDGDAGSVLTNSGNIDVSGGGGEAGGSAFSDWDSIYLEAQHVGNSGNLTADGGNGTTGSGGDGGLITLTSVDVDNTPTDNTGTLSVSGGTGTAAGAVGTKTIDGVIIP